MLRMRPLRLSVPVADGADGDVDCVRRRRWGFEMPLLERRVVLVADKADEADALACNV
jgi:hypothetical protein